jgi:ubiquitin C-terminal hydrolase
VILLRRSCLHLRVRTAIISYQPFVCYLTVQEAIDAVSMEEAIEGIEITCPICKRGSKINQQVWTQRKRITKHPQVLQLVLNRFSKDHPLLFPTFSENSIHFVLHSATWVNQKIQDTILLLFDMEIKQIHGTFTMMQSVIQPRRFRYQQNASTTIYWVHFKATF